MKKTIDLDSNKLTVEFPKYCFRKDLGPFIPLSEERCSFTAWFEFCVKLEGSPNLLTVDLQPLLGKTSFDFKTFDIIPYRDPRICNKKRVKENKSSVMYGCDFIRKNRTKCTNCGCDKGDGYIPNKQ